MTFRLRYPSLLLTSLVAGLYTLVVCTLLLADASRRLTKIPLEEPGYQALWQQLQAEPGDAELQSRIRALDVRLRQEYFRERRFTELVVYLLLAGIGVTLITARWAATLHRRLPRPHLPLPGTDPDEENTRWGLAAVAVLSAIVLLTAAVMWVTHRSLLPVAPNASPAGVSSDEESPHPATFSGNAGM